MRPNPTPGDQDLNKLESTLSEDASIQITAFLANRFLRRFSKNTNKFSLIHNYLLLKRSVALNF